MSQYENATKYLSKLKKKCEGVQNFLCVVVRNFHSEIMIVR